MSLHADRDGSERPWKEQQDAKLIAGTDRYSEVAQAVRDLNYGDALASFITQTKRVAKAERELADVKAENVRLREAARALVDEVALDLTAVHTAVLDATVALQKVLDHAG